MGCLLFDVAFTAALFLTGLSFGRFLLNLPLSESLIKRLCPGETAFSSLKQYLYFSGVWILFLSAMLLSPSDRTMLRDFPVGRKNLIRFLPGLITGFAANAVCVCGALLTRSFTLQPAPGSKGQLLVFLPVVLLQAGAEELAFRYYLYQKLQKLCRSPLIAAAATVLLFLLLHIWNAGFNALGAIEIILMGILLTLIAADPENLWTAIAFHTAWNASQTLLFGLKNSGATSGVSVFLPESVQNGIFYDAAFGLEGSIGACAVLSLAITALLLNRKAAEKPVL